MLRHSRKLFFDIETVPHPNLKDFVDIDKPTIGDLTNADLSAILEANGRPKSGSKSDLIDRIQDEPTVEIMEDLEERLESLEADELAKHAKDAALDPDKGMIVAIGFRIGEDGETNAGVVGEDPTEDKPEGLTEKELIETFWSAFESCAGHTVTWNGLNFDLPYIQRRSFDLGIKPTMFPQYARYRVEPTTDLMAILNNWYGGTSLKFFCKRYGIQVAEDEVEEITGAQVSDLDPETLRKYVIADVDRLVAIFQRMKGFYF